MKNQLSDLFGETNLLPIDGEVFLIERFFSEQEGNRYLDRLVECVKWRHEPITLFGKQMLQPRLTALHGDQGKLLRYSGIVMHPSAWFKELLEIKTKVESASDFAFNTVLLNYYRDGRDSMGWHRDNEKELGKNPVIASVSFGATRKFKFRNYRDKKLTTSIDLESGSLLLMRGSTQHHWEHGISKSSKPTGPRVNLTFRAVLSLS